MFRRPNILVSVLACLLLSAVASQARAAEAPRFDINRFTYELAHQWLIYKYRYRVGSDAQYGATFRCMLNIAIVNMNRPYSKVVTVRTTLGLPSEVREAAEDAEYEQAESKSKGLSAGIFDRDGFLTQLARSFSRKTEKYTEPEVYVEFDMGSLQSSSGHSWADPAWQSVPEGLIELGLPLELLDQNVRICALWSGLEVPQFNTAQKTMSAKVSCEN